MEVADQWRREWAGTAEYGKVIEGGVTRQIARAMEVLHASGPGAKVRVMRAAYHSTAGPGVPASSYMLHSSRRVISSGFNFMEAPSPTSPMKPLEISSIPLELSQDSNTENYKVTEPDDLEISEPSKWRSSLSGGSMRMPSEESSSTDNASIIDLDAKSHRDVLRKYSYDSENSDIPLNSGRNSRVSPLLDAPVALSTLKFKSLLNSNSDWNNRRKSYSFEDTSPLTETIMHSNDTLAMESSTDSGICKSTEIVNDNTDDSTHKLYKSREEQKGSDSFQNWLSNKHSNFYKGTKFKTYRDHEVVTEEPAENITLQSTGKVSITLPIAIETDEGYVYKNNHMSEETNRKVKKVEFCKTELHFAAETGRVNIISTDDKPPPSNDFRKRRSAFVPLRDVAEKPITLFGEKINDLSNTSNDSLNFTFNDINENDENTAATKSILKNKIPKPKPYLLGENMEFGSKNDFDDAVEARNVRTAVALINKQLQAEKWRETEMTTKISHQDISLINHNAFRTIDQGLAENESEDTYGYRKVKRNHEENTVTPIKKVHAIKRSPTPGMIKTRELRESDLTYFGISNNQKNIENQTKIKPQRKTTNNNELFQSVKLIQQVSNSVCNSESEDTPEYQNIPFNKSYVPTPTPRICSKFDDKPNQIDEIQILKPIIEQSKVINYDDSSITRRSKLRKQEEFKALTNRSRSEPRKSYNSIDRSHRKDEPQRSSENTFKSKEARNDKKTIIYKNTSDPVYENLHKSDRKNREGVNKKSIERNSSLRTSLKKTDSSRTQSHIDETKTTHEDPKIIPRRIKSNQTKNIADKKTESAQKVNSLKSNKNIELVSTNTKNSRSPAPERKQSSQNSTLNLKKEHRSRSLQRHNKAMPKEIEETLTTQLNTDAIAKKRNDELQKTEKVRTRHSSKDTSKNESLRVMPKVTQNAVLNKHAGKDSSKNAGSKDSSARSRSKRREYVINYDDKHGTVSSITKIRSNSGSPRRKGTKQEIKEKFGENLKKKPSDKVALRK